MTRGSAVRVPTMRSSSSRSTASASCRSTSISPAGTALGRARNPLAAKRSRCRADSAGAIGEDMSGAPFDGDGDEKVGGRLGPVHRDEVGRHRVRVG